MKALAEAAGYESLSEFARAAGVAETTMRQHVARDSVPKAAAPLYLAAAKGTDTSTDWLLYGRGKAPKGVEMPTKEKRQQLTFADAGTVTVSELDVQAQAGQGADGEFEITTNSASDSVTGRYSFPASGFREAFGAHPTDVIIAEVLGDSMMPTLAPGQKVMINTADKRPSPPGLFCLWDGLSLVIKRVELIAGSNPPTVRIKSDNNRYDTYDRTLEEAHINGRIVLGFTRF